MSPAPRPDLRRILTEVEDLLAEGTRQRALRPRGDEPDLLAGRLERAIARLDEALAELPPPSARLRARLRAVRSRYALHARRIPDDVLHGLYEDVRAGAAEDRWGRAGMSGAFLDAPRALARWRWTATAACLLLALGLGLLTEPAGSGDPREPRVLADPRDDLLLRVDAPAGIPASRGPVQPAGFGGATLAPLGGMPARRRAPHGARGGVASAPGSGGVGGGAAGYVQFHVGSRARVDVDRLLDSVELRLRILPLRPPAAVDREQN